MTGPFNRSSFFLAGRTAAVALLSRLDAFRFEAPPVGAARRRCGTTLDGLAHHGHEHFLEPRETILRVSILIARTLAGENQVALGRQARSVSRQEPGANLFGKTGAGRRRPAQNGLAVDLIDVLTSRPGTAHVREGEFAVGNLNCWRDTEHGAGASRGGRG